jgi:hypothetical protein
MGKRKRDASQTQKERDAEGKRKRQRERALMLGVSGLRHTHVHLEQVSECEHAVMLDGLADDACDLLPVAALEAGVAQRRDTRHHQLEVHHLLLESRHHFIVGQA